MLKNELSSFSSSNVEAQNVNEHTGANLQNGKKQINDPAKNVDPESKGGSSNGEQRTASNFRGSNLETNCSRVTNRSSRNAKEYHHGYSSKRGGHWDFAGRNQEREYNRNVLEDDRLRNNYRKTDKVAKNSPAFRSIQSTLSSDQCSPRNGRLKEDNAGSKFEPSTASRSNVKSVERIAVNRSFNDDYRLESDGESNESENEEECNSKTCEHALSPTFDQLRKAFEMVDPRSSKNISNCVQTTMEPFINDCQKWQTVIDAFVVGFACKEGGLYVEMAVQVFMRFIDKAMFQKAAYVVLMKRIGDLMSPREFSRRERAVLSNLCELFGKLLVSAWPVGWDSCAKECNMVLYAVMNVVQTWLRILQKSTSKKSSNVEVEVIETCALSLVSLTNATGRKLWLKWPELVDEIYNILKPVIVSYECGLSENTKSELLDLFVKVNDWPKPTNRDAHRHNITPRSTACQKTNVKNSTDSTFIVDTWSNNLSMTSSKNNPVDPKVYLKTPL